MLLNCSNSVLFPPSRAFLPNNNIKNSEAAPRAASELSSEENVKSPLPNMRALLLCQEEFGAFLDIEGVVPGVDVGQGGVDTGLVG